MTGLFDKDVIQISFSIPQELQQAVSENEILRSETSVDVKEYLEQIQKLTDNLDEYKDNLRKQIEVSQELGEKVSFYENEGKLLRNKLQSSLRRIETIENVICQAAQVIEEILAVCTQHRSYMKL